jgi:Leucine-rich repeat (LRR) protein
LTRTLLESAIIDEISQQIKANARVHLRNMGITNITKNMLKKFSDIFSIDLKSNQITDIEDEAFSGNPKLEKIDLMENRLTKITKKLLKGDFEDLQEINFSYNTIESIESGSFDKLSQLELIDLSFNCLRHMHSDLFKKCSELQQVYLHDNQITKIAHDLFNSKTDLKLLHLSRNQLDFIPELEMKKIKHFDISFNEISILDLNYDSHERKKSASISELNLSFNNISECMELDERRTDISHLDLTHNIIENLDEFPSFLNLEVLILDNNSITDLSLHNFEDRFPSLKVLNIRANPLECDDYRYVRNNMQSVVFAADSALIHRCHPNATTSNIDEYDEYEDAIIMEIRAKNREVVRQLKLNRSLLIILLSAFAVGAIVSAIFLMQYRVRLLKRNGNLIEQIEL